MSSRTLRKLKKDDELSLLASLGTNNTQEENTEKEVSQNNNNTKNINIFSLIGKDDDDDDDDGDEEEANNNDDTIFEEKVTYDIPSKETVPNSSSPSFINLKSKKAKKREKKNKKKNTQKNNSTKKNCNTDINNLDNNDADTGDENQNNDREFDNILLDFQKKTVKMNLSKKEKGGSVINQSCNISSSTLSVRQDPGFTHYTSHVHDFSELFGSFKFSNLDIENEYKNLFDDLSNDVLKDVEGNGDNRNDTAQSNMSAASFRNLQKLKKFTKNWGGRNGSNMKIVPQGPSLTRILQFSRIKNHWLPTIRGELIMKALTKKELSHILQWQRPNDWNDVIEQDAAYLASNLRYYRFEPLDVDQNSKMLTDFYLSVVLKPDHEAVINLVSSKFPYSIPALLQVAWIFTVQSSDGRTHSNDMVEKALFVFDRCFKNGILFNGVDCQLPFTFFYNRLFYLACFRHIQNLTGRGAFHTAAEWSKVLWSINPTNDPYGCRYFIDYYLILDKDYEFLIKLSRCRLFNQYEEWKTFNLTMSIIYAYYKMDMLTECKAFIHSQVLNQDNNNNNTNDSFIYLLLSFLSKLTHIDVDLDVPSNEDLNQIDIIQLALYEIRKTNSEIYTMEYINFLVAEIKGILGDMENKSKIKPYMKENDDSDATDDYFIYNIPINLIRFVVLSHESSLMAKLPTKLFDNYQLLEYDLLPPRPHTNEDAEILEDISSFIKEKDLNQYAASLLQDEDIMNRIQQLSLQEYIQQNENMAQE